MLGISFSIMLDLLVLVAMEFLLETPVAEAASKGCLRRLMSATIQCTPVCTVFNIPSEGKKDCRKRNPQLERRWPVFDGL